MSNARVLRVLVVDDSAYVRKVVSQLLSRSPFLEVVGTARDGRRRSNASSSSNRTSLRAISSCRTSTAWASCASRWPESRCRSSIVSVASESGELVLSALDAGAVDVVQKPTALASDRLLEISEDLIAKVKAAADARVRRPPPSTGRRHQRRCRSTPRACSTSSCWESRPEAHRPCDALIPRLPADFVGAAGRRAAHAGRIHRALRAQAGRAVLAPRCRGDGRAAGHARDGADCAGRAASLDAAGGRRQRDHPPGRPTARYAAPALRSTCYSNPRRTCMLDGCSGSS